MKRIISVCLACTALCSCSNRFIKDGGYREYINNYDSFDAMCLHHTTLNSHNNKGEPYLFSLNNDNWTTIYHISGIDSCVSDGRYDSFSEHPSLCDYLTERIYYSTILNSQCEELFSIIYSTINSKFDETTYNENETDKYKQKFNATKVLAVSFENIITNYIIFYRSSISLEMMDSIKSIILSNYTLVN